MKLKKKLLILIGITLLMLIWVSPITAQDSKGDKNISLYRMIVNERILKCRQLPSCLSKRQQKNDPLRQPNFDPPVIKE